ncbi:MAG: type II secretion system F family protein [Armatimonadetes bacterium]|nr:type II secretion system F family protein [Armatimonadota bacterium]
MPLFEYQAFTTQGKTTHGIIDAPSRAVAYERVRAQGLFPSTLTEDTATAGTRSRPENVSFALIQLATLLRAGMPLPQAIEALVSQVPDRTLQRALARIRVRLQEGTSFADALGDTTVFGPLLARLVQAGESVGQLDTLLEEYANFIERGQEYRSKVAGALMYPAVILTASLALVLFVLTNVAPTLTRIYGSFKMEMPLMTRMLLAVSGFIQVGWPYLLLIAAGVGYAWFRVVPRRTRDRVTMRTPILGQVVQWTQVSRWARTVALLHKGGVPLVRALASAREVVDNAALNAEIAHVERAVERGESLGSALRKVPDMPSLIAQMAETGERSGELDSLLRAAALFYEKEADRRLSSFVRMLEPAMILVMGLIVGFVVMAVLLPIFDIHQVVH